MKQSQSQQSQTIITFFVPKTKWGPLLGKPDWHPDVAQASVWIRGFQLAPYLSRMGYRIYCNRLKPLPNIAIFLRRYNHSDVNLARQIKAQGGKVIVDVVVNYFESRQVNPRGYGESSDEMVKSFMELLSIADQIWTVSPYLKSLASKYHPFTFFISDSVDPKHFIYSKKALDFDKKPPILGWSGITGKAYALDEISPIIQEAIVNHGVQVLVISNKKPSLSFPFIYKKWSYASFPKLISQCDLCIAPRQIKDNYDRGHSIFKIGVFMSLGVPALAGPVPSYELLLSDHLGGEICETTEDWKNHLGRFLSNPSLRQSASIQAKEKMRPYLTPNIAILVDQSIKKLY